MQREITVLNFTEVFEFSGAFTLNTGFSAILSIAESEQYMTLRTAVVTGVSIGKYISPHASTP